MKDLLQKITAWKYSRHVRNGTVVLMAAVICVVGALCGGCFRQSASPATTPTDTSSSVPTTMPATELLEPQWAQYDASEDAPFLPKDIFSGELYVPGLVLGQSGDTWLDATDRTDVGAFVIKGGQVL